MKALLDRQYSYALETLRTHEPALRQLAKELLERETVARLDAPRAAAMRRRR